MIQVNGEYYLDEPVYVVRFKCVLLSVIGVSLYIFSQMVQHALRIPLAGLYHLSLNIVADEIYEIARAPLYWIGLESAALYGIMYPYEGRAWFASIERDYHGRRSQKCFNYCSLDLCDVDPGPAPLAAPCFVRLKGA
jgi:hypothetical protein